MQSIRIIIGLLACKRFIHLKVQLMLTRTCHYLFYRWTFRPVGGNRCQIKMTKVRRIHPLGPQMFVSHVSHVLRYFTLSVAIHWATLVEWFKSSKIDSKQCSHTTVRDLTVVPFLVPVGRVAPRPVHIVVGVSAALRAKHKDRVNEPETNIMIYQIWTVMCNVRGL